jgi:cell division protein FtsB
MKKILKDKRVIVISLVVILVLVLIDFNQRMVLLAKLRTQEKQLEFEYSQLQATKNALEAELASANTDQAVEKWAREEGGMIQEGDIPIVLIAPSDQILPQPTPQEVIIDEVENWEIWQELFLGD